MLREVVVLLFLKVRDVMQVKEEFEFDRLHGMQLYNTNLVFRVTVRLTLKVTIFLESFHVSRVHELFPDDFEPRLQFCNEINCLCDELTDIFTQTLFIR